MIVDVRIPRDGAGSSFVMACAQARSIADDGDVALVHWSSDPHKTTAAYVWRNSSGYVVDTATLFESEWHHRLRRALAAAEPAQETP